MPLRSLAPAVIVAVKVGLPVSGAAGVKVAVGPEQVTAPETGTAPCARVKVATSSVAQSIVLSNATWILVPTSTPVALSAGSVKVTTGEVTSGSALVVKVHT